MALLVHSSTNRPLVNYYHILHGPSDEGPAPKRVVAPNMENFNLFNQILNHNMDTKLSIDFV